MFHLKRVQYFNDFLKCGISGNPIQWGDYYYVDDEDGKIVSAAEMARIKEQERLESFDYSRLNKVQSLSEYQEAVRQYEREYLERTIKDRPVFHKGVY
ncbi:hypothetical protein [Kurthia sp. Dielmo]|uniref:hypothetical protein n=1 Tax=Kurthia sp. Dielmo TaxID=1033738 RepID=UPI0011219D4C|nr:hypothetical protein [Kurthia sp. Dielmo]